MRVQHGLHLEDIWVTGGLLRLPLAGSPSCSRDRGGRGERKAREQNGKKNKKNKDCFGVSISFHLMRKIEHGIGTKATVRASSGETSKVECPWKIHLNSCTKTKGVQENSLHKCVLFFFVGFFGFCGRNYFKWMVLLSEKVVLHSDCSVQDVKKSTRILKE